MDIIYPAVKESDVVVLAAPPYYWTKSGQFQTAFDRLFALEESDGNLLGGNNRVSALLMASEGNGFEVIIHHSDSYAAILVPAMIQMGVDVWQGAVSDNNIPELLKKYGNKLSIQGGLDNGKYDKVDWSREEIHRGLNDLFETAGTRYLIPGLTMGGVGSTYDGVYDAVTEEINKFSKKYF